MQIFDPIASPDGRFIAFEAQLNGGRGDSPLSSAWVLDLETCERRLIAGPGRLLRDGYRDGRRDTRNWDRRWRDNRRYDWHGYRNNHRSLFNIGVYYAPYRNYYYSRLSIGYYLDSLFFGSRYWIDDPWRYRLPEVYGPYRWVRYYDDVLLVDMYTGEVVDVIYDFFW